MFPLQYFLGRFNLSANHQEFYNHRNSLREFSEYDEFRDLRFPIDPERVTKSYFVQDQ